MPSFVTLKYCWLTIVYSMYPNKCIRRSFKIQILFPSWIFQKFLPNHWLTILLLSPLHFGNLYFFLFGLLGSKIHEKWNHVGYYLLASIYWNTLIVPLNAFGYITHMHVLLRYTEKWAGDSWPSCLDWELLCVVWVVRREARHSPSFFCLFTFALSEEIFILFNFFARCCNH